MISVFEMFKIGIGPSSSHTVGPMKAANLFIDELICSNKLHQVQQLKVKLYGSLAYTGQGHGSDKAIIAGLYGNQPETVLPEKIDQILRELETTKTLHLRSIHPITFDLQKHIQFCKKKPLPFHSNGMKFEAFSGDECIHSKIYYSTGGGFVFDPDQPKPDAATLPSIPYPYNSAKELLDHCKNAGLSIARITLQNEKAIQSNEFIQNGILKIWDCMSKSIENGCNTEGMLPGKLNVKRRAPDLFKKLSHDVSNDPLIAMDWVNLFALAVNEENAAGGRVVTAPTNGASGIVPAVLGYYNQFVKPLEERFLMEFFLTASAIGSLYKMNASISGAEVGCQGEVGVACSMAAAGLTAVLGGSPEMVENAAEIGMEHNLGLTCDPIGGLVQIPCIERNAMGATKAINAARMALRGTGEHKVSLDKVIQTMQQTGMDMKSKYKETSKGGLAVNVVAC